MDVIFDIDGTLANAEHRLHWIKDMAYWDDTKSPPRPNWKMFLDEDLVFQDAPIPQTWDIMGSLLRGGHRIIFITGRNERTRISTEAWLANDRCPVRMAASSLLALTSWPQSFAPIYMRSENDRRPSHEVKRDLLAKAREDGYDPKLVFEDRIEDTRMWREEGLLCCQVADGNY